MEIKNDNIGRIYIKTKHGEAELLYKIEGKVMSIYHTFTPDEDRGHGIAEKLAKTAFTFAEKRGLLVRPDCPYILYFVQKNKIYAKYLLKS